MNNQSRAISKLLGAVLLSASSFSQAAVVADFAADFSKISNPSGAWQYGSSATLGGSFSPNTQTSNFGTTAFFAWIPVGTSWPTVGLNTGTTQLDFGGNNAIHLAAQQGLLHPGSGGEFAVVRLNVTSSFTGVLQTEFAGIDDVGTSTDVHVLLNGNSLFSRVIGGFGQTQSFNQTLVLHSGDVIDFAVGRGTNGNFTDDSTGFSATLSTLAPAVPEPSAPALWVAGLLSLAVARRRQGR